MNKKQLFSAAVAGIMAAACSSTGDSSKSSVDTSVKGECHGINKCAGTGDCGGEGHMCAGKNSCKAQGWIKMSKGDCEAKGGSFKK